MLLDVVVPGPGPVADVSVRYKDLVYRRNGVARAQLAVEDGHRGAHELARSARRAASELASGRHVDAMATLGRIRDLLIGIRQAIPGFDGDDELRGDVALLDQYLKVLASGYAGAGQNRQRLTDSLRFVAHRRLIPPYM